MNTVRPHYRCSCTEIAKFAKLNYDRSNSANNNIDDTFTQFKQMITILSDVLFFYRTIITY